MTTDRRNRGARPRRRALLLTGLLAAVPVLLAVLALTRAPAAAAPAGAPRAAGIQLEAYVKPAAPDRSQAAAGGICNVPGVGDFGNLIGACPKGGIIGDVNGQCKNPPVPELPGAGTTGEIELRPARAAAPAVAFGPHATTTEYAQYGYAGLFWATYDQSCLIPNPETGIENLMGNWALAVAKNVVATNNTVHAWAADPSWMSALTPIISGATSGLYRTLFLTWAGVSLICVAISVTLRANRSDMPGAVTLTVWALLVLGLVSAASLAPNWTGKQAQALMSSTLSLLDSGFTGPGGQAQASQDHDALLVQSVLFPAWERGELGDPNSAVARQYAGTLLSAQALSWAQASGPPKQVEAAANADQQEWAKTAAAIQKADPAAYAALTGNTLDRVGAGTLAIFAAVITCGFDFCASIMVVLGLLSVLTATVMLPVIGAAGMHHGMRNLVTGLGSRVFGHLLRAVMWATAAGIDQVATRALLTRDVLPFPLVLFLLAVLPAALWMTIRRMRGRAPIPPLARRVVMMGVGYRLLRPLRPGGRRRPVAARRPGRLPLADDPDDFDDSDDPDDRGPDGPPPSPPPAPSIAWPAGPGLRIIKPVRMSRRWPDAASGEPADPAGGDDSRSRPAASWARPPADSEGDDPDGPIDWPRGPIDRSRPPAARTADPVGGAGRRPRPAAGWARTADPVGDDAIRPSSVFNPRTAGTAAPGDEGLYTGDEADA